MRSSFHVMARRAAEAGRARTGILLWLLGVPIPIIIIIYLLRGCF